MIKRKTAAVKKNKEEKPVTLGDLLNDNLKKELTEQKQKLMAEEKRKKAAEAEKKREERRRKEKNKTFAELLEESDLNWKDFK